MQAAMDALFSVATAALLLRWAHVIFGIIWMGHLYFFNLVNVPFQGGLDKELKPKVNPALLLRAFWWFRWAAMYTFIFGWLLFFWHYLGPEHYLIDQTDGRDVRPRDVDPLRRALGIDHVVQRLVRHLAAPEADPRRHGERFAPPRRGQAGGDRRQGVALQHLRLRPAALRHARPRRTSRS